MCDDDTEAENTRYLELSRRELGLGAGAAVASLLTACGPTATASPGGPMPGPRSQPGAASGVQGREVTIKTSAGVAQGFFVAPEQGRHPAVLIWPDVAGLRGAFETMATRLAAQGYAVLAVNPYYRSSEMPVLSTFSDWMTEAGKAKIAPMREALTAEAIAEDSGEFVAWLDTQETVDTTRKIGTAGYCMGGPFTFRTAAASDRVGALASFHGGGLVSDATDSPHTLLSEMKAAALVCVARNDDQRQPDAKATLQDAARSAGRDAEVEVYAAQHGWCVIDSPVYDKPCAERAWARMLATFEAHL